MIRPLVSRYTLTAGETGTATAVFPFGCLPGSVEGFVGNWRAASTQGETGRIIEHRVNLAVMGSLGRARGL